MDITEIIDGLDARFSAGGTDYRAGHMKSYLKSNLEFRGVDTAGIRKEVVAFSKANPELPRQELIELVEACWDRPVWELQSFGRGLLSRYSRTLQSDDLALIESLVRRSHTWAHVDGLAIGPAADLIESHPDPGLVLDRWSADEDFWVRRMSMLALLPELRKGGGDLERFFRYADQMLDEKEFFIRKAIGWIMREISRKRPEPVYQFIRPRVERVSGVTIREAVKYLSDKQKEELMAGYRAR